MIKTNYKVLVIFFIIIMSLGYGGLYKLQGVEPTLAQKIILTFAGLTISNLISRQWFKIKNQ